MSTFKRSLSNENLDITFTIKCKDDWWPNLLDDDLKQHFTRLKLKNMKDTNFSSRPLNSADRIDARKYLYETFNEKLNEKNNDPALNKEINEFISEYEKQLFNTSNNDYAKYISELDKAQ